MGGSTRAATLSNPRRIRQLAILLAAASAGAMFYIGIYQSRLVQGMWCPLNGHGCETVADAPFARPLGVPDGYIGGLLYLTLLVLLLAPGSRLVSRLLITLSMLALVANVIGVYDMTRLGAFCTYCMLTTGAAPLLTWAIWRLR